MYGAALSDMATARHADLLREAANARRVAAARRNGASPPAAWRWRQLADLRGRLPTLHPRPLRGAEHG
jgi:hypothetical protein